MIKHAAMVMDNKLGRRVRDYFISCEGKLNAAKPMLVNIERELIGLRVHIKALRSTQTALDMFINRMEQFLSINSQSEDEFAKQLNSSLEGFIFFERFYVAIRNLILTELPSYDRNEMHTLVNVVESYYPVFGESVFHLSDEIRSEYLNILSERGEESLLKVEVLRNIDLIVEGLIGTKTEYKLKTGRRCDIFCRTKTGAVIIELKTSSDDPTRQLLQYAEDLGEECKLIAITSKPLPLNKMDSRITYYTLSQLRDSNGWRN